MEFGLIGFMYIKVAFLSDRASFIGKSFSVYTQMSSLRLKGLLKEKTKRLHSSSKRCTL
jgi:hypothetical protein